MDNLEDFLKGSEPTDTPEAEPIEAPQAEVAEPEGAETPVTADRPRGPDGKFIPKGETVETVASPATEEPQFEHAATIGERRRRQTAEAEVEQLRAELARIQQPQPQAPQQVPDMFEDPDGFYAHLRTEAVNAARAEAMQAFQYQRIETSAANYRAQVPDYDEKIGVFGQMVQGNPALLEQLHRVANPAEYAYNTAKTQLEISQYGGIDGLVNARVAEALKTQQPATPVAPIPDTLADAQSARASTSAPTATPPSLDSILGAHFR